MGGRHALARFGGSLSHAWDRAVLLQLSGVLVEKPALLDLSPADPRSFWEDSRARDPRRVHVEHEWDSFDGPGWRELELAGESEGPGDHEGARRLVATAHVRSGSRQAPLVLVVHGYAIPFTGFDRWLAWRLRRRGLNTMRLDLPFHLRRTVPGQHSGDHYFSIDPPHTRDVVRQSVEDAAAVVAWARRELSPDVRLLGTSLGGLIALLLTALVPVQRTLAVAPLCDPAASFTERPPGAMQRHLGMLGEGAGYWGRDRTSARRALEGPLAPLVLRNLQPVTAAERVTLVEATDDLVVGGTPVADLAAAWHTDLWRYPFGHITVMNAPGMARRVIDHLAAPAGERDDSLALAG